MSESAIIRESNTIDYIWILASSSSSNLEEFQMNRIATKITMKLNLLNF
jgi:hypothetical protein